MDQIGRANLAEVTQGGNENESQEQQGTGVANDVVSISGEAIVNQLGDRNGSCIIQILNRNTAL